MKELIVVDELSAFDLEKVDRLMSDHDRLGRAATSALVTAAEKWPELVDIQKILADEVRRFQSRDSFVFEVVRLEIEP